MTIAKFIFDNIDPVLSAAAQKCRDKCQQEGLQFAIFAVLRDNHNHCNHMACYTPDPISSEHLSTTKAHLCRLISVDSDEVRKESV
jgi:hypothetical protein